MGHGPRANLDIGTAANGPLVKTAASTGMSA
jgi:hypothetical protein